MGQFSMEITRPNGSLLGGTQQERIADRLRVASKGLAHDEIAARLAAIRQGRNVEERDKARELERRHAEELEQEREERERDRGLDHEL